MNRKKVIKINGEVIYYPLLIDLTTLLFSHAKLIGIDSKELAPGHCVLTCEMIEYPKKQETDAENFFRNDI